MSEQAEQFYSEEYAKPIIDTCEYCENYSGYPQRLCFKTALSLGRKKEKNDTCDNFKRTERNEWESDAIYNERW